MIVACSPGREGESPVGDPGPELSVAAVVEGTPVTSLVVEVSAPDITRTPVFTLPAAAGAVAGTIRVPAGVHRTIRVRGHDGLGAITHVGEEIVDVEAAAKPAISVRIVSAAGYPPILVDIGPVSIVVTPRRAALLAGGVVQLAATVREPSGQVVAVAPRWETGDATVATVDAGGVVHGVHAGSTRVLARYGGVASGATVDVMLAGAHVFGEFDTLGVNTAYSAGYLFASAVESPLPGELLRIGVVVHPYSVGSRVQMGVYSDAGGAPGALVANTAVKTLAAGHNEFAVPLSPLAPGRYWITAVYEVLTYGFGAPSLTRVVKYTYLGFGAPLPEVFPTPSEYLGVVNHYVVVRI